MQIYADVTKSSGLDLFEYKAPLLASRCFGVLALAIFGDDDLTDSILDYFIVSYFEYLKYKEKQFFL